MKKIKSLLFTSIILFPNIAFGQFNTITNNYTIYQKSPIIKPHPKAKSVLAADSLNVSLPAPESVPLDDDFAFYEHLQNVREEKDTITTYSLELAKKIEARLNVCLPLDKNKITSNYGYRIDPFSQKKKFHDGIDLRCNNEYVYSMLPAKVIKIRHEKKGYGNYIILNHGKFECLYGHLDKILVKENDIINAGTIVAISGNSGKSTGPHLHIRIKEHKKSINPITFINSLSNYIHSLDNELNFLLPKGEKPTLNKVFAAIKKEGLLHPTIVLSQACLETGYFTSNVCKSYNNLFGLRDPKSGNYYRFDKWEDSVKAYRDYVQYKYHGGNYYQFLYDIGYAEDPNYVQKVHSVHKNLKSRFFQ